MQINMGTQSIKCFLFANTARSWVFEKKKSDPCVLISDVEIYIYIYEYMTAAQSTNMAHAHDHKKKKAGERGTKKRPAWNHPAPHRARPQITPRTHARAGKRRKKEVERRDVMARLYYSPSYFLYKKEKVQRLLFLTQKGAQECLKFTGRCRGGDIFRLGGQNPRLLFISSAYRSAVVIFGNAEGHLKIIFWQAAVTRRNRGDLLCCRLTSPSAPRCVGTVWAFQLLPPSGEDFQTLSFHA